MMTIIEILHHLSTIVIYINIIQYFQQAHFMDGSRLYSYYSLDAYSSVGFILVVVVDNDDYGDDDDDDAIVVVVIIYCYTHALVI